MQVDDKYKYSCENKDLRVHEWISTDQSVGFWQITASDEFRAGGPVKQNLTSHVGPIRLAVSSQLTLSLFLLISQGQKPWIHF